MGPDFYIPMRLNEVDDSLQKEIKENLGIELEMCLECGKCSGGCSNAQAFDYTPRKIVQLLKFNDEETLLRMDALWICLSCQLCLDRCPSGIDIPRLLDYLRAKAYRKGLGASRPQVQLFYELMLSSVRKIGRVSEFQVISQFNRKTGQYLKDAHLGWTMFLKGKVSFLSPHVKEKEKVRRLFTGSPVEHGGNNR
jgi:heterodisulfide reductase subunit C